MILSFFSGVLSASFKPYRNVMLGRMVQSHSPTLALILLFVSPASLIPRLTQSGRGPPQNAT